MTLTELQAAYSQREDVQSIGADGPSMTMLRVWRFLAGWSDGELQTGCFAETVWNRLLDWPPDVFALCSAVLKRSGVYTFIIDGAPTDAFTLMAQKDLDKLANEWRSYIASCIYPPLVVAKMAAIPDDLVQKWLMIWQCRFAPLYQIPGCPELLACLMDVLALADEVSRGSGLPLERVYNSSANGEGSLADIALSYPLIYKGWHLLEPKKYGSTLCTSRLHPSAGRVLPKMHTARSGLTQRSFTQHLAFCETDEVQPRWFMMPRAREETSKIEHINLLVIPWPFIIRPAQFRESQYRHPPLRRGGVPGKYFTYDVPKFPGRIGGRIERLCDEAQRLVGTLDGVLLPEVAVSTDDYQELRTRVLARRLILIAGVGSEESPHGRGTNQLCVDVPLSSHHAVHFRQAKQHRWKLEGKQIEMYGIGGRLNTEDSYWENIEIGDRRLLFIVLRRWLVTSILICEDLARHDPVGELLRSVGPHLVVALLMDGPQLTNRWPSRYAAVLADDPGSSVLSISSLGMVGLSRAHELRSNRSVAMWRDGADGVARELTIPDGASGLVLTISVRHRNEVTADARGHGRQSAVPVLTGVHPIYVEGDSTEVVSEEPIIRFLAPHEATALARLSQQDIKVDSAPVVLRELTGEAKAIAQEIWRLKTGHPSEEEMRSYRSQPEEYAGLPTAEQTETAKAILRWSETN